MDLQVMCHSYRTVHHFALQLVLQPPFINDGLSAANETGPENPYGPSYLFLGTTVVALKNCEDRMVMSDEQFDRSSF
jgi:hypothetical protein